MPGLKLASKRLYDRVFEIYTTTPVDFIDAYHAARLEKTGEPELYSYDADFDRIEGIRRFEPAARPPEAPE